MTSTEKLTAYAAATEYLFNRYHSLLNERKYQKILDPNYTYVEPEYPTLDEVVSLYNDIVTLCS